MSLAFANIEVFGFNHSKFFCFDDDCIFTNEILSVLVIDVINCYSGSRTHTTS